MRVEETIEEVYNYFVDGIHTSQAAITSYKTIRSQKGKSKFKTDRLMHYMRPKRTTIVV